MADQIIPEEWRPVVGYEGWYEVSSIGRVRRVRPGKSTKTGRFCSIYRNKTGYNRVKLTSGDYGRRHMLHRLVARAFIGECPHGCEINHRDGNKDNNHVENLEYVTHKMNMAHASQNRLMARMKGMFNPRAKLTDEQVREMRRLFDGGCSRIELSRRFHVGESVTARVVKRQSWVHIEDHPKSWLNSV